MFLIPQRVRLASIELNLATEIYVGVQRRHMCTY